MCDQIADVLRREILRRCRPGDKLGTVEKLAARFGTSTITLSKALLRLSSEGLIESRQGSGTYVLDPPSRKYVALVSGLYPGTTYLSRAALHVSGRLQLLLNERGHPVQISWAHGLIEDEHSDLAFQDLAARVKRGGIFGIVSIHGPYRAHWTELLDTAPVPVIGRPSRGTYVRNDTRQAVIDGVAYLCKAGCRRIAFMDHFDPDCPDRAKDVERKSFRAAVAEHGCRTVESWIRGDLFPNDPGAGYEEFKEIWTSREEKPDGLVIMDDVLYPDAAVAILESKIRAPDQLRVITHANKGFGAVYPFPTARLEVDLDAIARTMADLLFHLAAGGRPEELSPVVPHRLVEPAAAPIQAPRRSCLRDGSRV